MIYSDFTIEALEEKFGIEITDDHDLFPNATPVEIPQLLTRLLERFVPLATTINTEKARGEFIIAPILAEFTLGIQKLALFSGIDVPVDQGQGLTGRCDYILSRSATQLTLGAPILVIVEAKNENIIAGIPQCIAGMLAAHIFNKRKHTPTETVYGIVTTGSLWRFLKLTSNKAHVDSVEYSLGQLDEIMGILTEIVR
uniref:Type I restriction enzyme R protein N terminus (HSDR_N) n=1 Tax=Candidatus Kentrum sp. MB TaxID=2138164 RepID=A0A451BCG6_9GAMM|nr:MAG: hypothetical protein BECKMB1821G_GA0114241_100183 [Candidatus Kentron sp. MB]VFK32590.1 MAG: hypothetical protein BECKMB1821I_GA0114274_10353 [Candidatus Kentron sp. MB]VFK75984.1 MAG: hypothetical protein BECKMB1821H_GA0114242_10382 [Candidatus Kentron sp. MB]